MTGPGQNIKGLYLISDTAFSRGRTHEDIVLAGLAGGAMVIQLREKSLTIRQLYPIALRIREMTRQAGATLIINDLVELAMAVCADGVHLGQQDIPASVARRLLGPEKIIGVSTHSLDEAVAAQEEGADYIGFGPIYKSGTKDSGEPKGPEGLMVIREGLQIPIVAIGGIDALNARAVIDAGADAVAVISAVAGADDMEGAAREIVGVVTPHPS